MQKEESRRVCRVNEGLIDHEHRGFRAGRGCVDQIFTMKQIGEKAQKKKHRVYMSFMDLDKAYNRANMKALWQVLRIYDRGSDC